MNNLLNQKPIGLKRRRLKKDKRRLEFIRNQRCCICEKFGLVQLSITQAHHVIMGRYGTRKSPDKLAIPLCEGHHQGNFDKSKVAIHREPKRWRELFGEDYNYSHHYPTEF